MRPRAGPLARALALAAGPALVAAAAWWWTHPPDPARELRARNGPLARVERTPLAGGMERWRLVGADGAVATGLWRPARARDGAGWTAVLLGGIGTDERAVHLVPEALPLDVLAVGWPWEGPRRMSAAGLVARAPALRAALLRTPGALALGIEAARRAGAGRVALLGASAGVPPTVAALALARPDALVLVDGAADLRRLLRAEIGRELGGGWAARALAGPAAGLGARLVSALEPAGHAGAPGMPVLLLDAERERRYPPECVASLHAAFPGATIRAHPGGHVRPENHESIGSIAGTAWRWLEALPPSPPATARRIGIDR